jgi:4-amino-4-deoxy-L-arabinose transferase-like glycosyltransferase
MVLGRLFSFFAEPEMVAVWINRLSALCSSFTILFLYWSITMFGKKIMQRKERDWSRGDQIATLGAGIVGALAYAFSDSFWFSAVEGEVYAMSSLFTAAIFWMILKWDSEMIGIKHGEITDKRSPMRWMILIWFMFGLAIGVHLLGLLAVPAIAFVMYFNMWEKTTLKGIILTGLISVVVLAFVQEGIWITILLGNYFLLLIIGRCFYVGIPICEKKSETYPEYCFVEFSIPIDRLRFIRCHRYSFQCKHAIG